MIHFRLSYVHDPQIRLISCALCVEQRWLTEAIWVNNNASSDASFNRQNLETEVLFIEYIFLNHNSSIRVFGHIVHGSWIFISTINSGSEVLSSTRLRLLSLRDVSSRRFWTFHPLLYANKRTSALISKMTQSQPKKRIMHFIKGLSVQTSLGSLLIL